MTSLSDLLLTGVITYGAPVLALILLIGSVGVPAPTTLLLIATGAFLRQGILDWPQTVSLALLGTVVGDNLSFAMGRFGSKWVLRRFGATSLWKQGQAAFDKQGSWAIFLTRFLVGSLALPVNLIAGSSGYRFSRFLALDIVGEVIWIGGYAGLGYLFGSEWETISQTASDFSGLALGLAVLGAGIYFWFKQRKPATQPVAAIPN
jgi:membrane protein DedA with SNARE-associated domain